MYENLQINDWDLTTTNLHRLSQRKYQVAVIPTAAIEPHNRHLPQGQDFLHTDYIAKRCCQAAWQKTESVICLPAIPFGVDCNQIDFPMAIHVGQSTLDKMLTDIIRSLRQHNIRKIVIINGHGGNDFTPLIRQLQSDLDVFIFLCNWWLVGTDEYNNIFTKPDDHAGQMETSVAMALYPQLIEPNVAGSGQTKPFRFDALKKGWVKTSRNFAKLNDHCAAGDPSDASADKGRKYLDLVCERLTCFLTELAEADIDENFPHTPE